MQKESQKFPESFLDYIPPPSIGHQEYTYLLKDSYESDTAKVAPIYALLKVTDRCQSRCVYCSHAGENKLNGEPSTKKIKDIIDQLAALGVVSINFSGGEPLLRQDLPELVKYAGDQGLYTILLTNGLLLQKRAFELRDKGLGMLIVSVDSVDPEAYLATRGVALPPVIAGIEAIANWPDQDRPAISVTSVITNKNIDHLNEIVSFFEPYEIGTQFTIYHHHGRWEEDSLSVKERLTFKSALTKLHQLKKKGSGVLNSYRYLNNFEEFTFNGRKLPRNYKCYCGYTTLFIDSMLNVRSCWSHGLPTAGNLNNHRLQDLLKTNKMMKIRKNIRKIQCERCWLLCTAEISLRFQ